MTAHKAIREAKAYAGPNVEPYVVILDKDRKEILADLDAKTAELERLRALRHVEMTDEQIIEIRKASKPTNSVEQWGMTLSFARKLIEAYRGITALAGKEVDRG